MILTDQAFGKRLNLIWFVRPVSQMAWGIYKDPNSPGLCYLPICYRQPYLMDLLVFVQVVVSGSLNLNPCLSLRALTFIFRGEFYSFLCSYTSIGSVICKKGSRIKVCFWSFPCSRLFNDIFLSYLDVYVFLRLCCFFFGVNLVRFGGSDAWDLLNIDFGLYVRRPICIICTSHTNG